ncbi:MAG: hypothetical protein H7A39_05570 [Chlamydiales bacterium]|nr:hypothetical protein [Chlamydiales bacterium]
MKVLNMRHVIKIALFLVGFIAVERLCHLATDGFSLSRIQLRYQIDDCYKPDAPPDGLFLKIDQPFRYLASGSQSFAFISKDGNYVLKFFKLQGSLYALHKGSKRRRSFAHAFQSCLINERLFNDESNIIYCHLTPSNFKLPNVELLGPGKIVYHQDLSTVPFVIQKFAETTKHRLTRLKKLGDLKAREQMIDSLIALMLKRYLLGYSDKDPNWIENFGFLGDRAVSVDVGGLIGHRHNLKTYFLDRELVKTQNKAIAWLNVHDPELVPYVEKKVAALKNQIQ